MGGEEEDDLLPLALVGEILQQRLANVVGKGLDEAGVSSPAVDEAKFHLGRVAADRMRILVCVKGDSSGLIFGLTYIWDVPHT